MGRPSEAKAEFVARLTKLITGAMRDVTTQHGGPAEFDGFASSVAKRVAAQMWSDNNEDRTCGEWLKVQRGQLGLSQRQLADAIGVPLITLQRWENGQPPTAKSLEKIQKGIDKCSQKM